MAFDKKKDQELEKKHHLMAYDLMQSTAGWLENADNELFGLLEYSDDSVNIAAKACVLAAAILKKAALDIQLVSGIEDTNKYEKDMVEAISDLKSIADSLDASGDDSLMKKASALDEILFTIVSNVEEQEEFKKSFARKIEEIKKHSYDLKHGNPVSPISNIVSIGAPQSKENAAASEKKNSSSKDLRPLQAPLSTRYCPDHPGEMLMRISDGVYQCMLDHKEYDFKSGFTTAKGNKVPGTSVENQTINNNDIAIKTMFGK